MQLCPPRRARFLVLAALAALPLAASAESWLSANDLKPAQLSAPLAVEAFTINASAEKGVTIEPIEVARTAPDGEVFNARIKLNGGGAPEYRSIRFKAEGKASLKVYLCSSSKTDARILKLVDAAGTLLAELAAPPDDGAAAGLAGFALPGAGEYLLFSAASGINIYLVALE